MSLLAVQGGATGTGTVTLLAPVTNTNRTLTLPDVTDTVAGIAATQTLTNKTLTSPAISSPTISGTPVMDASVITSGTAVTTTTGTSIDFTSIPSWVKRITVMFMGVGTNGNSIPILQLGDSGGVETTSYLGSAGGSNNSSGNSVSQMSVGFNLIDTGAGSIKLQGRIEISLANSSANTWCANGTLGNEIDTTCFWMGGSKSLSGVLDRVRLTTVNGTDSFDAGSINICYE